MRGRDLFNLFYWVFRVISFLLFIIPAPLVARLWVFLDLLPGLLGVGVRYSFALRLSKKIGRNVFFGRGVEVICWEKLALGSNVSFHKDCYIDASGGLTLGDDVSVAHASSIMTFEHTWEDLTLPIRSNPSSYSAVVIESDVWIGCGCRVLAGVSIASRSVVAAGAVVAKDVPAGVVVGGVPARIIKSII